MAGGAGGESPQRTSAADPRLRWAQVGAARQMHSPQRVGRATVQAGRGLLFSRADCERLHWAREPPYGVRDHPVGVHPAEFLALPKHNQRGSTTPTGAGAGWPAGCAQEGAGKEGGAGSGRKRGAGREGTTGAARARLRRQRTSRHIRFSRSIKKSCCGPITEPGRQSRIHPMISHAVI
eukprot:scaffold3723_cov112-Isochrysis_galbana.AAC.2